MRTHDGIRPRIGTSLSREGKHSRRAFEDERNLEDHEALIVVAATKDINYEGLVPLVGETLAGTMARARDGGQFIAALADTEPSRLT